MLTNIQAYSVTKSAQIHLMKCLAVIASPEIRVNSVSPGMLLTVCTILCLHDPKLTMVQEWGLSFPQAKRDATIRSTKLGRLATVEVNISFYRSKSTLLMFLFFFFLGCGPTSVLLCPKCFCYGHKCGTRCWVHFIKERIDIGRFSSYTLCQL